MKGLKTCKRRPFGCWFPFPISCFAAAQRKISNSVSWKCVFREWNEVFSSTMHPGIMIYYLTYPAGGIPFHFTSAFFSIFDTYIPSHFWKFSARLLHSFLEVIAPRAARTFFLQFCAPPSLFLEVRAPRLCVQPPPHFCFLLVFAFRASRRSRAFAEHQHRDSIKYQRKWIDLNDLSTDFHQIQFSTSLRAFECEFLVTFDFGPKFADFKIFTIPKINLHSF